MLAPYYFCHKASLQLVGSYIIDCPFNSENFMPDWSKLEEIIKRMRPVMIVITTPCNPSGAAWTLPDYHKLVELSRNTNTWLIFDQTYAEFLFDKSQHIIPCSKLLEYENIIHISSFSKNFGMPGWRVGYTIAPKSLTDSFRKIQDTIPTCAPIISQKLALACLAVDNANRVTTGKSWVQNRIESLQSVREAMWCVFAACLYCVVHMWVIPTVNTGISQSISYAHTLANILACTYTHWFNTALLH